MIREGIQDYKRHKIDKEINTRTAHTLSQSQLITVQWQALKHGDVVKLVNGDHVPADLLIFKTSEPDGSACFDTKNIDGETNLSTKYIPRELLSANINE